VSVEKTRTDPPSAPPLADIRPLAERVSSLIALIQGDKLIYINPAGCALLGHPPERLVGLNFWEVVHPDDREAAMARGRARQAGIPQPKRLLERLLRADGRTLWIDYSVDLIQYEGRPTTLVTGFDITERLNALEVLRKSEANLAEAQRIAQVGGWEWDLLTDRVSWSAELFRIYGLDPRCAQPSFEFFQSRLHPDDRSIIAAAGKQAHIDGRPFECELRMIRPDGEMRILWTSGRTDLDPGGRPLRMYGAVQDITDRRRAQEALKQSEEQFRLTFMNAAIGKAIIAPDRRLLQANPAVCRMLGYTESELLGISALEVTHPEDVERTESLVRRVLDGSDGASVSDAIEKRFRRKDGRVVWGRLSLTLVRDAARQPLYFLAEIEDITERRKAEEALRESEERFRNLCTLAPVMLMAFSPDGKVRDVSNYWLQTMGYEREEVVGREGWGFITGESEKLLRRAIEENERSHELVIKNLPLRGIRKDGTTIDLLSTSVAEVSDSGECIGAICVEINLTDLQRAEEALRESEERYRALVEHAPEAIMVLDAEKGHFVDANANAEKLFGWPRERLVTMGPTDICTERQASGQKSCEVVDAEIEKVLGGETRVFEASAMTASGRQIECQTRLSRLPTAGRKLIRVTTTDITELKELQEKVRHAEKLAAVGVLAAGVAHEIGNPLMALSQAAQSLERRSCDDYAKTKLSLIGEHIDRISRIVRQMSNLARPQNSAKTLCDLNSLIRRAVDMVRYDKRSKNSEVLYELSDPLPAVQVVEDELMQVFINLALNAFDAMAENPSSRPRRLTIRSRATASHVRISFQDSGPGVAPDIRPNLFQPFYTTKETGRGTGLGLSVSYRILQEHRGSLRLEEESSPGAVFVLELPLRSEP
jgi:PAS domain S-box-containing protein